jgi:hypothetical protein
MHVTENATAIDDKLVYNRSSTAIVRLRPVKHNSIAPNNMISSDVINKISQNAVKNLTRVVDKTMPQKGYPLQI